MPPAVGEVAPQPQVFLGYHCQSGFALILMPSWDKQLVTNY